MIGFFTPLLLVHSGHREDLKGPAKVENPHVFKKSTMPTRFLSI